MSLSSEKKRCNFSASEGISLWAEFKSIAFQSVNIISIEKNRAIIFRTICNFDIEDAGKVLGAPIGFEKGTAKNPGFYIPVSLNDVEQKKQESESTNRCRRKARPLFDSSAHSDSRNSLVHQ